MPCGALLALAFAPVDAWLLAVLCPAALFLLWHDAAPREAAWRGLLFTGGTFLAGTYWLYHSIHLVGQAPLWIALFLMLGLVAIMGAYTAAIGYAAARWLPASGATRWLVVLPSLWALTEWVRGWFLSGFPWLALGYSQLATPLRWYAPVLGIYGVSLAVAVTAGAVAALVLGQRRDRVDRLRRRPRDAHRRSGARAGRVDATRRRAAHGGPGAGRGPAVDEMGRGPARAHDAALPRAVAPALRREHRRLARVGDSRARTRHHALSLRRWSGRRRAGARRWSPACCGAMR